MRIPLSYKSFTVSSNYIVFILRVKTSEKPLSFVQFWSKLLIYEEQIPQQKWIRSPHLSPLLSYLKPGLITLVDHSFLVMDIKIVLPIGGGDGVGFPAIGCNGGGDADKYEVDR